MDIASERIPEHAKAALRATSLVQVVHSPSLDTGFYQWLLLRARAGVKVEVLFTGQHGVRHTELTPHYFKHLEQAGGRVFLLPEQKSLPALILLDAAALLQPDNHAAASNARFTLEEHPDAIRKLRTLFDQWKESGRISSAATLQENPIQIYFKATPQSVDINEHFELSWEVSGADLVNIQPLPGQVSESGRQFLSAEKTTEFCLSASNARQTLSSVVTVTVNPNPKIEYLLMVAGRTEKDDQLLESQPGHPDHYGVVKGQVLRLFWRVYNAQHITFDGHAVAPSGNQMLTPDQLHSYIITASGENGSVHKTIVIDVFPRAEIEQIAISAPVLVNSSITLPPTARSPIPHPEQPTTVLATFGRTPKAPPPTAPAIHSSLREFFWFCSGASRQTLRQCPDAEGNKYAGIGATVFFTGLLAALSGGYALFVAFRNPLMALLFGLLWGAAIFNLDRLIVSTIKKEASLPQQWLQAMPRFLLALVLSVVIAKPLELRIFKPEIDEILSETRAEKLNKTEALFRKKALDIEAYIEKIKTETAASFQTREALYQEYRCECDGTCGTGKLGRGSECERKEAKYQQVAREYTTLKTENDRLVEAARVDMSGLKEKELLALQEITSVQADGLVARLSAAQKLPLMPSLFIALLILMIEIAPVLSKIMAPRGPYDEALRVAETRFNNSQEDLLRQVQAQADEGSSLNVQLQQAELDQALEHKREILRIISGAQVQLVQDKVDRWLEAERKKIP